MRKRQRSIAPMLLVAVLAAGAGCGSGDPLPRPRASEPAPAPTGTSVTPDDGTRWLSVIEQAPRADDLDELTQRVRDLLGRALVVSPADCLDGLPPDLDDGYVVGAVGSSREDTERLVVEAGETAIFTGAVTIVCTD